MSAYDDLSPAVRHVVDAYVVRMREADPSITLEEARETVTKSVQRTVVKPNEGTGH